MDQVIGRFRFAIMILSIAKQEAWGSEDVRKAQDAEIFFTSAKNKCMQEFDKVIARWRKYHPHHGPTWQEAGDPLLRTIHNRFPQARTALLLSNLNNRDCLRFNGVSVGEARRLHQALAMGAAKGVPLLQGLPEGQYILWALPEQEALARTMESYSKYARTPLPKVTLSLVVPFEAPLTCTSRDEITDLWSHQLLGDKWANIIQERIIFEEPGEIIASGCNGPVNSMKSFLLVTLSPETTDSIKQEVVSWNPSIYAQNNGPIVILDVQEALLLKTQRVLQSIQTICPFIWDRPLRSPGSSKEQTRYRIRGYMPVDVRSSLQANIILKDLRRRIGSNQVLAGLLDTYKDPYALVADITDVAAAYKLQPLCSDVLLLSSTKVLIRTDTAAPVWQEILSRWVGDEPDNCTLRIKWKGSQQGGRVWAQPAATERQIQAVRAQASVRRQGKNPRDGPQTSTLTLQGTLGPNPQNLAQDVFAAMATKMQMQFQQQGPDEELQDGGWAMLCKPGSTDLSGRIQVRFASSSLAASFELMLNATSMIIGGERVLLQVSNSMMEALPTCGLGNAGGAPSTAGVAAPPGL